MKPKTNLSAIPTAGPEKEGDLVSNVYHLVDCLRRLTAKAVTPEGQHYHDAGQTALAAALVSERRLAELAKRVAQLEQDARSDELTGLLNRRGFFAEAERALAAANRYGETGMLVYIDLDGFKDINDTHGHCAGDTALRLIARILTENVRATDYVARLGGDEFAVLLTHATHEQALGRAEILDQILNTAHFTWEGREIPLAASIGVQFYHQTTTPDALIRSADEAMYKTKNFRRTLPQDKQRA